MNTVLYTLNTVNLNTTLATALYYKVKTKQLIYSGGHWGSHYSLFHQVGQLNTLLWWKVSQKVTQSPASLKNVHAMKRIRIGLGTVIIEIL